MQFETVIDAMFTIIIVAAIFSSISFILRRKIFEFLIFSEKRWAKKVYSITTRGESLALSFLIMFLFPIAFGRLLFGWSKIGDQLLSCIILGIALVGFSSSYAPRLMKPLISIGFLPAKNSSYEQKLARSICLRAGKPNLLWFQITNLGVNFYENCTCWITFPTKFSIIKKPARYKGLDFLKRFEFQRKNNCVMFLPTKNYMSIAPFNRLVLPIWVKASGEKGKHQIQIGLASETRWGEVVIKREIEVV